MTTTEMAAADARAVAATKDTDHEVHPTNEDADALKAQESLVVGCMQGEEAGVMRMTGTGRGLEESPEGGLDLIPDPQVRERTSIHHRPPITLRRKCGGHTLRHAPGPGLHRGHAHVLGPDPGQDESQAAVKKSVAGVSHLLRKDLFVLT